MSTFVALGLGSHRASIAAKIEDAVTGRPVGGASARITTSPPAFERWLDAHPNKEPVARAAADGIVGFIDLPNGDYTVALSAPGYGVVTRTFNVANAAAEGASAVVSIEAISLPPSGVRGAIRASDTSAPLPLARVRVMDSGEIAHCDAAGNFYVGALQAGTRRLTLSAQGYVTVTTTAVILEGHVLDLGTLSLNSAGA